MKKRVQFHNFCESINRFTGISYVWKVMSTYKNSRKNIEWNNWSRKNREATIIKEINKLAPPAVDSRMLEIKETQNNRYPELNDEFSYDELERALGMIRKNTAPGLDGIEYRMLKELPKRMKEILLEMFNIVWTSDIYPEDWRKY